MKKNMSELAELTIDWAQKRNLIHRDNANKQMLKVMEEVGELAAALAKGKELETVDAIGDSFVTLIILAAQLGYDPELCLEAAYNEIANRKGKTVNGVFLKNDDYERR